MPPSNRKPWILISSHSLWAFCHAVSYSFSQHPSVVGKHCPPWAGGTWSIFSLTVLGAKVELSRSPSGCFASGPLLHGPITLTLSSYTTLYRWAHPCFFWGHLGPWKTDGSGKWPWSKVFPNHQYAASRRALKYVSIPQCLGYKKLYSLCLKSLSESYKHPVINSNQPTKVLIQR